MGPLGRMGNTAHPGGRGQVGTDGHCSVHEIDLEQHSAPAASEMTAPASVTMSAPAAWSQIFSRYPACGKRRFTAASPRASAPATAHRTRSEAGTAQLFDVLRTGLVPACVFKAEASLRHGAQSERAASWAPQSWPVSATGMRAGILTYCCYAHDTPVLVHASAGGGSNAPPSCTAAHPRNPAALAPL